MATHHKVFNLDAPIETVREWVKAEWPPRKWKILKQEFNYMLLEEKMFNDVPYDRIMFIGPAKIEINLRPTSTGTEVVCDGQNEYYGDDPPPKYDYDVMNKHWGDVMNGQWRTQESISLKVSNAKYGFDQKFKEWSAQQRYRHIEEEKRLPQKNVTVINASAPPQTNSPTIKSTPLKSEQLSVEDFIAQLERLAYLRRSKALTNAEFEEAKLRLLKATE